MRHPPHINRRHFIFAASLTAGCVVTHRIYARAALPPLMLAEVYDDADPSGYWISEKYDGMRAYWDGLQLLSRAGNPIAAPNWFLAALPAETLDGELWIDRGRFEQLTSTVRDSIPDESAWKHVRYMVFDMPRHQGPFSARLATLQTLIPDKGTIQLAPQWHANNQTALMRDLERIVTAGGEGLMLKRDAAPYQAGRSSDLLKLKPYQDAEAQVVAHIPGKGKHAGRLGALEVRRSDGVVFRIGTGFTDAQRETPVPVGSWVTYRFHGETTNGIPRFASFLRQRE